MMSLATNDGAVNDVRAHDPPSGPFSNSPGVVLPDGSVAMCLTDFSSPSSTCVTTKPGELSTGCTAAGFDTVVPTGDIAVVDAGFVVTPSTDAVSTTQTQAGAATFTCTMSTIPTTDVCTN